MFLLRIEPLKFALICAAFHRLEPEMLLNPLARDPCLLVQSLLGPWHPRDPLRPVQTGAYHLVQAMLIFALDLVGNSEAELDSGAKRR